jgi:hypothetical protein
MYQCYDNNPQVNQQQLSTTNWILYNRKSLSPMISTNKKLSQIICQTLDMRKTKFEILYGVCCSKKSNHNQMVSEQYNKHKIKNVIKIMIQTMLIWWSKQLTICESKNKRDREKEYTKICLGSSPIDLVMGTSSLNSNLNWESIIINLTLKMYVYKRWEIKSHKP